MTKPTKNGYAPSEDSDQSLHLTHTDCVGFVMSSGTNPPVKIIRSGPSFTGINNYFLMHYRGWRSAKGLLIEHMTHFLYQK